jgi:hypothetical protein
LPGAKIHASQTSAGGIVVGAFLQNPDNNSNTEVRLAFGPNDAALSSNRHAWIGSINTGSVNSTALTFATGPGGTSAVERARISSDGTFRVKGAGTAGSTDAFQVAGAAPADAARIDSSGNLLVGTTSALGTGKVGFLQSASGQVLTMQNSNAVPYGIACAYTGAAPNNSSSQFLYCDDTGGLRMEVRSNGGIANYTTNNSPLSDRRLKKDITPAGSYLEKICAIPVVNYFYKDQTDDLVNLGVIAQDVLAVAPELCNEEGWGTKDEDGSNYLGIWETDIQYALMKCIQEQQALITQLTARITALEGA